MTARWGWTVADRDAIADGMLPVATDLVCRVHDWDAPGIRGALADFGEGGLRALCVVLAAMVPDDRPLDELIGWTHEEPSQPCSRCREPKLISEFPKTRARATGRHPWCKDCHNGTRRKSALQIVCEPAERRAS